MPPENFIGSRDEKPKVAVLSADAKRLAWFDEKIKQGYKFSEGYQEEYNALKARQVTDGVELRPKDQREIDSAKKKEAIAQMPVETGEVTHVPFKNRPRSSAWWSNMAERAVKFLENADRVTLYFQGRGKSDLLPIISKIAEIQDVLNEPQKVIIGKVTRTKLNSTINDLLFSVAGNQGEDAIYGYNGALQALTAFDRAYMRAKSPKQTRFDLAITGTSYEKQTIPEENSEIKGMDYATFYAAFDSGKALGSSAEAFNAAQPLQTPEQWDIRARSNEFERIARERKN